MSVTAKVEIAASETAALAQSQAGTMTQSSLSVNASGEKSFRDDWESQMAAISTSVDESSESTANQNTSFAEKGVKNVAGISDETTLVSSAGSGSGLAALRLSQTVEKGNDATNAESKLSAVDAHSEEATARSDAKMAKSDSTKATEEKEKKAEEKKSSTDLGAKSSGDSSLSVVSAKPDDQAATSALNALPTACASVSQAAPTPTIVAPFSTEAKTQSASADFSEGLSIGSATASFGTFGVPALQANAAGLATVKISETLSSQGQAATASSGSEASRATLGATKLPYAQDAASATATAELSTDSSSQLEVLASSLEQSQSLDPSQNSSQTLLPGQSQTSIPVQSQTSMPLQSQNKISVRLEKQNVNAAAVSGVSNQLEISASGLEQSQSLDSSQNSPQTLLPSQSQTRTHAQSQDKLSAQSESQSVNTATASSDRLDQLPVTLGSSAAQVGSASEGSSMLDKSGSISSAKLSTSSSVRAIRKAGNVDSAQQTSSTAKDQSFSTITAAGASTIVREVTSLAGHSGSDAPATTAESSSRETFAALDAGTSTGSPAWIHAGAQRAEAGFQDPTLGWVGVRATTSGGAVHAQVMTDSADAAQALGSQLSGLNDYLVEHRTPVETLTLTASDGGSAGWNSGQSAGQGMQQGTGQQSGQGTNAGSQISSYQNPAVLAVAASRLQTGLDGSTPEIMPGDIHISVMA